MQELLLGNGILQDEIIQIQNLNDTLYKNIWNKVELNSKIDYCTCNMDKENVSYNLYWLQDYRYT